MQAISPDPFVLEKVSQEGLRLRKGDGSELVLDGSFCAVMGIVNVTPDSFSDGGKYATPQAALVRAEELCQAGADVLDFGAESTRSSARLLSAEEEWQRLRPIVTELPALRLPAVLSIDTRHAQTANRLADLGFSVLNLAFPQHLFSPTLDDPKVARWSKTRRLALLQKFDALVVMHSRGTPSTMRDLTDYGDKLCDTVIAELLSAARMLTDDLPSLAQRLFFDPGLGFAKTAEQSLALLRNTAGLRRALGRPLVIGASRKSMWSAWTGQDVDARLLPSVVGAAFAASSGADVVRVHDVTETKLALSVVAALCKGRSGA